MFISSLSPDVIKWPTQQQNLESSEFFNRTCYFSKAIGCIDGTHIQIDPPKRSKDDYINRKGITFINIFVGYPGSSHDSWVLQNSTIYDKLPSYCGDYYLLGDSAYPCKKYLVTPYRDNGHLTNAQKYFNLNLSSGRIAIEHSFGMLKQRFRQIYYCKLRGMEKLCHFIRACCVLHNIANEDDLDFICDTSPDVTDDFTAHGDISRGNHVRDPICQEIELRRNT
ncbi:PREDICTED: putative nuclease HARBI1 [Rhagoletis zephyria]|uniref:putative nuclease HARBI1 n=1 Tax=Rhagoletis zephyria TaxID=28612 RepID=UPI0008114F0E|nr:PREDICTED: putative nuclease HARBI1 [Rhagoletis zephyria]